MPTKRLYEINRENSGFEIYISPPPFSHENLILWIDVCEN